MGYIITKQYTEPKLPSNSIASVYGMVCRWHRTFVQSYIGTISTPAALLSRPSHLYMNRAPCKWHLFFLIFTSVSSCSAYESKRGNSGVNTIVLQKCMWACVLCVHGWIWSLESKEGRVRKRRVYKEMQEMICLQKDLWMQRIIFWECLQESLPFSPQNNSWTF